MSKNIKVIFLFLIISLIYSYFHLTYHQEYYQTHKLDDQQKKELYFSEGAFYYSFYNDLVSSDTYIDGLKKYFSSDRYEAPNTINPHKRFNISFELFAGTTYRTLQFLGIKIEPTTFYDNLSYIINGLSLFFIFLIIYLLTKSMWSFILPLVIYLSHHSDATRVLMNTALRENIGITFFLAHSLTLFYFFKEKSIIEKLNQNLSFFKSFNKFHFLFVFTLFLQLTFWQFTQFILIIEIIAILTLFTFKHLSIHRLFDFFLLLIFSWFITVVYLAGSAFILNSLFFFISICFIIPSLLFINKNININNKISRSLFSISTLSSAVLIHFCFNSLLGQQNDSHVFNFIMAQFTESSNFHSQLYLCDSAFNKISSWQIDNLFNGGFLYLFIISLICFTIFNFTSFVKSNFHDNYTKKYFYYIFLVTIGLAIIAYSGQRFFIVALPVSLIIITYFIYVTSDFFSKLFKLKYLYLTSILALSLLIIFNNKTHFSELFTGSRPIAGNTMTQLTDFISSNTSTDSSFAGSMPVSSSIVLLTGRKIFIHPQYENQLLRDRVKEVYKIFGNFSEKSIYTYLKENKIDYIVSEASYCHYKSSTGCVMQTLINEGKRKDSQQFCNRSFINSDFFEVAFDNKRFKLLKLK